MLRRILVLALLASPALYSADKTTETLLEVLRDIAGLHDQLQALEKSLDGKLASLTQGDAERARASAADTARSLAALGDSMQKSLQKQQDQQAKAVEAMAAMGSQLQSIADQLNTTRQAVSDLTSAMSRLTTEMGDLSAAVKSAQESKPAGGAPPPEISAGDLFASAEGDRLGGKLDIAVQEYSQYVAKFGDTPQAADAQYYVGSIHYSNQEWDDAVKAFDAVMQNYPDSKRMPETLYYKADSLARSGHRQDANDTLQELRRRFPDSPLAKQKLTAAPAK